MTTYIHKQIQVKRLVYCPAKGDPNPYPTIASDWREAHKGYAWLYDPWTGIPRGARAVGQDPCGYDITPNDLPYYSEYENTLARVRAYGNRRDDRTGTGTLSLFGQKMEFDLSEGRIPLVTTKKVHFKSIIAELLWMLSGSTNVKDLQALGCTIWDEWARADGSLGPIYGAQWRSWPTGDGTVDQISKAIELLRADPTSRRNIVSAWNVSQLDDMALAPCHMMFQLYVEPMIVGLPKLHMQVYQRSADMFLGVPFNIASYAVLTHMIAAQVGMDAGTLHWVGGDCHIYCNHIPVVETQLQRDHQSFPRVKIAVRDSIFGHKPEDFELVGYHPHRELKATVAV